jgi:acyl dehydratase
MGVFLEDFETGKTFTTGSRTIGEDDVLRFAGLSGDLSKLHTSEEYAKTTAFGRCVAHGALVFSVSVGLTTGTGLLDETLIAFSRVDNLRFARPVFIGDTISVSKTVLAAESKGPTQGLLSFDTRVRNQHGEVVLAYIDRLLIKKRFADVPASNASAAV